MNRFVMWYLDRIISTLFLTVALSAGLSACGPQAAAPAERPPLEGAKIGGPFTLVDKDGKTVRWSDFDGQYRIVYFGFTFCPDACPMDMQALAQGLRRFEEQHPARASRIQPIFITIDPARDTPEAVGQFAAAFHPRLIGLTGTAEQVDEAASAFAAYYAKGEETGGGYLMDHSRIAYLMGPDGAPIAMLPVEKQPVEDAVAGVAAELEKWVI